MRVQAAARQADVFPDSLRRASQWVGKMQTHHSRQSGVAGHAAVPGARALLGTGVEAVSVFFGGDCKHFTGEALIGADRAPAGQQTTQHYCRLTCGTAIACGLYVHAGCKHDVHQPSYGAKACISAAALLKTA